MGAAKIMAKDLVRTRQAISKFHQMRAQLQATSIRIQTMSSTASMADAMKGAAKAMYVMNKQVRRFFFFFFSFFFPFFSFV